MSTALAFGHEWAIGRYMRSLRHWPALLWLAVYVGSVLVLMGSHKAGLLAVGAAALLTACGGALYLALREAPGHPRPGRFVPALVGVIAFYVIAGIVAAPVGPVYVAAAVLAGVIPTTAVAIMIATSRKKSVESEERLRDTSADDQGPFPGVGIDDSTSLGDTPEVQGDLRPHDLPKGHPGRRTTERRTDGLVSRG